MNKEFKDLFTLYQEALELKELGFDEPCFMFYNPDGHYLDNGCTNTVLTQLNGGSNIVCSTPLYQQAFRWFREKHKFFISIYPITVSTGGKNSFRWRWAAITMATVLDEIIDIEDESDLGFLTYEEAELACLKKLIEIVKNK